MTTDDREERRFLEMAIGLAVEGARADGGPFGAVVVRDGEVIATGTNRVTANHDPTAHAEIVAIREACRLLDSFQLEGCDVYASSEPCPMCLAALYWARPRRVVFASDREAAARAGFDDGRIYDELARPPGERKLETLHLEVPSAGSEFVAWVANENRREY